MSGFSRLAVAATLIAGFGSVAQAQSQSLRAPVGQADYYAVYDRGAVAEHRSARASGAVAPSMSGTVMGLRVPR